MSEPFMPVGTRCCAHGIPFDQSCAVCGRTWTKFTSVTPDPTAEMLRLLRQIADDVSQIKRNLPR